MSTILDFLVSAVFYLIARPMLFFIYLFVSIIDFLLNIVDKIIEAYKDDLSDLILGLLGIGFAIYAIIEVSNFKSEKQHTANSASYSSKHYSDVKEPETKENKNKFISILSSKGKYGKFTTYIDENSIEYSERYMIFIIGELYNKCSANMPYCEKYKVVTIDCDNKKFVISSEVVKKENTTIKETAFTENETVIRKLSSSRAMSVIAEKYCRTTPPTITPTNYTPKQTNKRKKKDNYQNDYIVPYTPGVTLCRDGTYSSSSGRGTCSHHGGVQY